MNTPAIESLEVRILGSPDMHPGEVENLTLQLQEQLEELRVRSVERPTAAAPPGARGLGADLGLLTVQLAPAVLPHVVSVLKQWTKVSPALAVEVELDGDKIRLSRATSHEQDELVKVFLQKHAADARSGP